MVGLVSNSIVQGMPDAAPNWMWNVTFIGVSNVSFPDTIYATDISIPQLNINVLNSMRGGKEYFFPGYATYSPLEVQFYESHRYPMTSWLNAWRREIVDQNGLYGRPADYMGTGIFVAFDSMGIPVLELTMQGVWPTTQIPMSFSSEKSGPVGVAASFRFHNLSILSLGSLADTILQDLDLNNLTGGAAGDLTHVVTDYFL